MLSFLSINNVGLCGFDSYEKIYSDKSPMDRPLGTGHNFSYWEISSSTMGLLHIPVRFNLGVRLHMPRYDGKVYLSADFIQW